MQCWPMYLLKNWSTVHLYIDLVYKLNLTYKISTFKKFKKYKESFIWWNQNIKYKLTYRLFWQWFLWTSLSSSTPHAHSVLHWNLGLHPKVAVFHCLPQRRTENGPQSNIYIQTSLIFCYMNKKFNSTWKKFKLSQWPTQPHQQIRLQNEHPMPSLYLPGGWEEHSDKGVNCAYFRTVFKQWNFVVFIQQKYFIN
jgi:hypothetical protein